MREQTGAGLRPTTPPRQTTWLSSTQPGRTSTGTYAGIPGDASHSTVVIRNNPRSVKPYQRDVQFSVHNGPPSLHMQRRASRSTPTTQVGYYEDYEEEEEEEQQQQRPKRRMTFWGFMLRGAVFLVACYLIYILGYLFFAWVQNVSDNIHYGTPRTYQTDKDVGHGGVSHFTVENLNGHIIVVELPNDDPSKALVYSGPTFSDATIPAIVTFKTDATTGQVIEMDIDVNNTQIPFINGNDGKFHSQGQ